MNEHLGGAYLDCPDSNTYMPDVWQMLIDKYKIKSMVDVGCGAAWNTAWWHDMGYYAWGIEGWPEAIARTRMPMERMIVHDYTTGPLFLPEKFDLAWCSEFVEHVEERYIPNFMATFQCCRYVCMTYATPGQGGYHHVNEQELDYWIEKMKAGGFEYDEKETTRLRATDVYKAAWGRKTLTFFRNRTRHQSDA